MLGFSDAGWSSLAARRAHNPKVTGSNPVPATNTFLKWFEIEVLTGCFLSCYSLASLLTGHCSVSGPDL